jgi:hypothetical protein
MSSELHIVQEISTGSRGESRGGSLTLAGLQLHTIYLSFSFSCMHLVNGNSYTEICAQRNAEDGVFILSELAHKGGNMFLIWFWLLY